MAEVPGTQREVAREQQPTLGPLSEVLVARDRINGSFVVAGHGIHRGREGECHGHGQAEAVAALPRLGIQVQDL